MSGVVNYLFMSYANPVSSLPSGAPDRILGMSDHRFLCLNTVPLPLLAVTYNLNRMTTRGDRGVVGLDSSVGKGGAGINE